MKNKISIILYLILSSWMASAIDVSVTHCQFYNEQGNYLEIYTRFEANNIHFEKSEDSLFQAKVLALILIKKDDQVITADKFSVDSPMSESREDFWSMRQYKLEPGEYKLEYTFSDLFDAENSINEQRVITIEKSHAKLLGSSDILLMAKVAGEEEDLPFRKYGFSYEPLAFDILSHTYEKLIFNWEIYQADQLEGRHFISFTIYEGFSGELGKKVLQKHKMLEKNAKTILLEDIPILDLASGQYHLTLEICDQEKKSLHYKDKNFTLLQPISDLRREITYDKEFENSFVQILNMEELEYSLRALATQLPGNMVETLNTVLDRRSDESMRYFLYSYWSSVFPDRPGDAYEKYMEVAKAIDREFGSHVGYGFETDRGYIYMKYGRPNDIIDVIDEINTPPYSIWAYANFPASQQNNVKFLFYNPSLSGDDFVLLHSNCNIELQNPQWEQVLYSDARRELQGNTIDGVTVEDNFNRKARRYFNDN